MRVGAQFPRQGVVLAVDVEDALEPVDQLLVGDGRQRFDSAVEVARHEVGRPDVVLAPPALAEAVDPGVFEVAAHDRTHGDGLGQAGYTGPQAAHAAHDEVDLRPRLRRPVEGIDHIVVDEVVHLHDDAAVGARLLFDETQDLLAQLEGRDEELVVVDLAAVAGEIVEQLGQVLAEGRVAGEQPDVLVETRRLRVVVAGAHVAVAADDTFLFAHDEGGLGVGLEADEAVHHVHAHLLQSLRPLDVGLLVEAGLELHQGNDLLALLGGLDEGAHDGAVARGAVQGLLDGQDLGVDGRVLDEVLDRRGEAVVGMVDEQLAFADHREDGAAAFVVGRAQPRLGHRHPRLVLQLGAG